MMELQDCSRCTEQQLEQQQLAKIWSMHTALLAPAVQYRTQCILAH